MYQGRNWGGKLRKGGGGGRGWGDVLNTRISKIKTMKPSTPPLVPYFQVLPWLLAVSVSSAMAKETRSRLSTSEENMAAVCLSREVVMWVGIVEIECGVVD